MLSLSLAITCLCACGKSQKNSTNASSTEAYSLRNVMAEVGNGLVFFPDMGMNYDLPLLYYWDTEQNLVVPLCGKADCSHTDETCNAYFEHPSIYTVNCYQDHIYLAMQGEKSSEQQLVRVDLDGSNREVLCQIEAEGDEWIVPNYGLVYQDTFYMKVSTNEVNEAGDSWAVYAQPLDGKSKAKCIYKPQDDAWSRHDPDDLFICGDKLYFSETKYRDTETEEDLYCYDLNTGELTLLLSGESTGYVMCGDSIYFRTSRFTGDVLRGDKSMEYGPVFRYDLATGEQKELDFPDGALVSDGKQLYLRVLEPDEMIAVDEEGNTITVFPVELNGDGISWTFTEIDRTYILFYQSNADSTFTWHLYQTAQVGEQAPAYLEYVSPELA
jgi:hypothetical protein